MDTRGDSNKRDDHYPVISRDWAERAATGYLGSKGVNIGKVRTQRSLKNNSVNETKRDLLQNVGHILEPTWQLNDLRC